MDYASAPTLIVNNAKKSVRTWTKKDMFKERDWNISPLRPPHHHGRCSMCHPTFGWESRRTRRENIGRILNDEFLDYCAEKNNVERIWDELGLPGVDMVVLYDSMGHIVGAPDDAREVEVEDDAESDADSLVPSFVMLGHSSDGRDGSACDLAPALSSERTLGRS